MNTIKLNHDKEQTLVNTMLRLSEAKVKCNQDMLKKPGTRRTVLRAVTSLLLHHLPVKETAKIVSLC